MKDCNGIVLHGIIFENVQLGEDVSKGNWQYFGADLLLQSPNAEEEMRKKEGSGLATAL